MIPVYYGEVAYRGAKALVLSDVGGVVSFEQKKGERIPRGGFKQRVRVRVTTEELARRFHIVQSDFNVENVILVEDRAEWSPRTVIAR